MKQFYITIDDAPSCNTYKKIAYLVKHQIPAIFYCRGEHIEQYREQAEAVINAGFLIGNHSYSHQAYSETYQKDFFADILRAEELIERCYKKAALVRPKKVIRLPFGDRGATGSEKQTALQNFLAQEGFERIDFACFTTDTCIDAPWSIDPQDYKRINYENPALYQKKFEELCLNFHQETGVLLLHDFDHNHELFEPAIDFLRSQKWLFL